MRMTVVRIESLKQLLRALDAFHKSKSKSVSSGEKTQGWTDKFFSFSKDKNFIVRYFARRKLINLLKKLKLAEYFGDVSLVLEEDELNFLKNYLKKDLWK